MKNALLFLLLISISLEQGYNQGYAAQGNYGNNPPNQNSQYIPQQYGNMGQNGNIPQINQNEQNQQNGNFPQGQNNQQEQNGQPYINNQYGNQEKPDQNQYGNQQNQNENQYGNQQGQNQNQYGIQQNQNDNQYGNQQNQNENQYGNQQGQNQNQYGNQQGQNQNQYGIQQNQNENQYGNQQGQNENNYENSQNNDNNNSQNQNGNIPQQQNPQNQIGQQTREYSGNVNQQNQENKDNLNKEELDKNSNLNNQVQGNQMDQQYPQNQQYPKNQPNQYNQNQQNPQNFPNQQDGQQNQYQQNQQYQESQQNQQNQQNQFPQNQYQQYQRENQQENQQNQQNLQNQYPQSQQYPQNQQYQQNQQNQQNQQYPYQQNQQYQNQQNQQYPYQQSQQYPNQQNQQYPYQQNQQYPNQQNQQYPYQQNQQNQQYPNQQNQQYPYQQNQQNQQYQNQQNQFYQNRQQQGRQFNNIGQNQYNNQVTNNLKDLPFPEDFISIFDPKKVNLSRHFEDCDDIDVFCRKSLTCKFNRCFTSYEVQKSTGLGLKDKNMCEDDDDCPAEKECIKHRCADDEDEAQANKRNLKKDPSVNLLFAGGIFLNNRSYESGAYPDGTFNYDHLFKYIQNDIKKADLAIVDQETIFETDKMNFIKKVANTPSELGDAIYRAGFKLVLHGSLYAFTKEERGIKNTLNFWTKKYPDVKVLGIDEKEGDNENDYFIFKKNSIKIGLINFYGHGDELIPEDKQYYVNILTEEKLKDVVEKLSNETDFLIVCMNWGDKNSQKPNKKMIQCAKELAYFGVDLIIGYHPSLALPTSYVKASNGKRALVFWSLGHLVLDVPKPFSILGAMANITISKSDKNTYISSYNLIPTINHKVDGNQYSVYKLSQYSDMLFQSSLAFNCTREDIIERCEMMMGGLADCY